MDKQQNSVNPTGTEGKQPIIIKKSLEQVLEMKDKEGLVCLGTGGPINEWIDGVNEILVEENVTTNEKYFSEVITFVDYDNHDEPLNCLLFVFHDDQLDIGRLAIARLQWDWMKWLSDFIANTERMYEEE